MPLTVVQAGVGGTGTTDGFNNFKNRIINGAMVIDQRNAGASITPTNGQYSVDRWLCALTQASKFTAQQSSIAPTGFINSALITSSSAYSLTSGDFFGLQQRVEGLNISDLAWGTANAQTVTLSFWVRSSLTGTFSGALNNGGATISYPFTYTISSANTWEKKSVTITGPTTGTWLTNNSIGIIVNFSLGMGSTYAATAGSWQSGNFGGATGTTSIVSTNGATFYITGVQLEVSSTASGFDYRPYGTELALCQRYCFRYNGMVGASRDNVNLWQPVFRMPVTMRATPSLAAGSTMSVGSGSTGTWFTYTDAGAVASPNNLYLYNGSLNWSTSTNAAINGVFEAEL